MKVAAVQFIATGRVSDNIELACARIREAAGNSAQLIVLPEASSQAFETGRLDEQAEGLDGKFATALHDVASELGVVVVAGMFRPADQVERDGKTLNRVYNSSLITGRDVHKFYDKVHTYDAFNFRESDTVKPGEKQVLFDVAGVTVGGANCFDIRFPAFFQQMAKDGAELIVVPTSWHDGPGKTDQWRLLNTARAIDTTCYILGADQAKPGGEAEAGNDSGPTGVGHSVLVDPHGVRTAEAGYDEEILYGEVDPEEVRKARKALPILDQV